MKFTMGKTKKKSKRSRKARDAQNSQKVGGGRKFSKVGFDARIVIKEVNKIIDPKQSTNKQTKFVCSLRTFNNLDKNKISSQTIL